MIKSNIPTFLIISIIALSGCGEEHLNESFRKFEMMKTAECKSDFNAVVGLIEVHKIRNGIYPETLSELKYLGAKDSLLLKKVEYALKSNGYELNVKPELAFGGDTIFNPTFFLPNDYWSNIGVVKSNLMK